MAQHTQLILTLLERLGSRSRPQCDLASQLLLLLLEDRGVKTEQVRPRGGPQVGGGPPASRLRLRGVREPFGAYTLSPVPPSPRGGGSRGHPHPPARHSPASSRPQGPAPGGHGDTRSLLPLHAQVAEILQGLFQELSSVMFKGVLQTMMKVVTVLGTQYTQETVEVILSLCHPSERWVPCAHDPEADTRTSPAVALPRPHTVPGQIPTPEQA